jgi:hypothetical protein
MPSQSINFANITYILANGSSYNRINRPGATRLWERVWIPSSYQVLISQGYWVDPDPYYYWVYPPRYTGWWDTGGGGNAAQVWGVNWSWGILDPYFGEWNGNYSGWYIVTGWYGYNDLWQWYYDTGSPYQQYTDPAPYWVDTSYYQTYDNSYWAYYY